MTTPTGATTNIPKRLTGWRKIAGALWHDPDDPQIYGSLELDARPLLRFMTQARAAGHHVTPTHLVGRALAVALAETPGLNVRLLGDRAYPRPSVDIFFITAVGGGHDLSGVKVEHADQKSAAAVAGELHQRATDLKAGRDPQLARSKHLLQLLPKPVLRLALRLTAFLSTSLDLRIDPLGLEASPFGSAMVSSVGMFGLPMGFAPLSYLYKVPAIVLVGEISEKAMVEQGQVVPVPVLPVCVTIDHRYADGWHIGQALVPFKRYLADPGAHEPAITGMWVPPGAPAGGASAPRGATHRA